MVIIIYFLIDIFSPSRSPYKEQILKTKIQASLAPVTLFEVESRKLYQTSVAITFQITKTFAHKIHTIFYFEGPIHKLRLTSFMIFGPSMSQCDVT